MVNCKDAGLSGFETGSSLPNTRGVSCRTGYPFCMFPIANPDYYGDPSCTDTSPFNRGCTFDIIDGSTVFKPTTRVEPGTAGHKPCHTSAFSFLHSEDTQDLKCGCMHKADTLENRVSCCVNRNSADCPMGYDPNTVTSNSCDRVIKLFCSRPENYYNPACACFRYPPAGLENIPVKCYSRACQSDDALKTNAMRGEGCSLSLCNIDINAISLSGNISISDINISQQCQASRTADGGVPGVTGGASAGVSDNGAPRTSPIGEPKKDDPLSSGANEHPDLDAWLNKFLDSIMLDSLKSQSLGTKIAITSGITLLTIAVVNKLLS